MKLHIKNSILLILIYSVTVSAMMHPHLKKLKKYERLLYESDTAMGEVYTVTTDQFANISDNELADQEIEQEGMNWVQRVKQIIRGESVEEYFRRMNIEWQKDTVFEFVTQLFDPNENNDYNYNFNDIQWYQKKINECSYETQKSILLEIDKNPLLYQELCNPAEVIDWLHTAVTHSCVPLARFLVDRYESCINRVPQSVIENLLNEMANNPLSNKDLETIFSSNKTGENILSQYRIKNDS